MNTLFQKITSRLELAIKKNFQKVYYVAYDADGTLWSDDLGLSFYEYQVKNQGFPPAVKDPVKEFAFHDQKPSRRDLLIRHATAQAGHKISDLREQVKEFLEKSFCPKMFSFQLELIKWFRERDVRIFIVSSSLKWVLDGVLVRYGFSREHILGVETQVDQQGYITDNLVCPPPIGAEKILAFKTKTNGVLPLFSAGNTMSDESLLKASKVRLVCSMAGPEERNYKSERKMLEMAKTHNWFYSESIT